MVLLTISIPAHNKSFLLDKAISSIIKEKEFANDINLTISDNSLNSDIRKLYLSLSPFTPDNNHLHQLFFNLINTKIFKSKIVSNNLSSVIINFFNFIILYTAAINPYNTIYQIKLISFSIACYILAFFLLKNKINKF